MVDSPSAVVNAATSGDCAGIERHQTRRGEHHVVDPNPPGYAGSVVRRIPAPLEELGFRGHDVTADGTSTFVVRGGTGRPVVLLHGYPQDWTVWSDVMADLVDTHDVVVPTLPGIGASQVWPGGSSTPALADWLSSVLAGSGIAGPVTVVGHDVGAWIAAAFAAGHPGELTELMLIDAFLPGISDRAALALRPDSPLWHMHLHAHADALRVLVGGQLRTFLAWFLRSKSGTAGVFPDSRIDHFAAVYGEPGVLEAASGFYRALAESIDAVRAVAAGSGFDGDVFVVSGETGRGRQMIDEVAALWPNVDGQALAGRGHYIPEEAPAELARLIRSLATPDGPDGGTSTA
jgi:pimeloyl-ACP methyl ester carboxylesterase